VKPLQLGGSLIYSPLYNTRGQDRDGHEQSLRETLARKMGSALLEHDAIEFTIREHEQDQIRGAKTMYARSWVIPNADAALIEAEEAKRVRELVDEIVDDALAQVDNWGSYFRRTDIEKYQVALLLRAAVERKLGRKR